MSMESWLVVWTLIFTYNIFYAIAMQSSHKTTEFAVDDVMRNIDDWEKDMAIMFYAPWCEYCKYVTVLSTLYIWFFPQKAKT